MTIVPRTVIEGLLKGCDNDVLLVVTGLWWSGPIESIIFLVKKSVSSA